MFFDLPMDVIRTIYMFDNTYSEFYTKNIIPLLKKRIFSLKNQSLYCVVDLKNKDFNSIFFK